MSGRQRKEMPNKGQSSTARRAETAFVRAFNEGMRLQQAGQPDQAVTAFRKAMIFNPSHPSLCNNLGVALAAKGELDEAALLYRKAITLDPAMGLAHSNLSDALMKMDRYDEALAAATRATALQPDSPEAFNNLGCTLLEIARFDEAIVALKRSLEVKPDYSQAYSNMGCVFREMGRVDESISAFRQALAITPNLPMARKNMGLALMQKGDYAEGWREYGWRWVADGRAPRDYTQPLWKGESLSGKTILLYAEQGLGDAIQFARFVPLLAAPDVRVVFEVHPQLVTIMRTLEGVADVIPLWSKTPQFDLFLPIMDVPGVTGMTVDNIPSLPRYLSADPARVAKWREHLGDDGFKVGIVWQGFNGTPRKRMRHCPLSCFAPLAGVEGVRLISLQKTSPNAPADPLLESLGVETLGPDFDAGPDAFLDTAAVMENLDLVITIDTSVAHMAGALGRPVWIALPKVADWRWLMEGSDTAWYPSARLYRQSEALHWDDVFADMAADLTALATGTVAVKPKRSPRRLTVAASNPTRDYSRFDRFLNAVGGDIYPEVPSEPHLSITESTIESLQQNGLIQPGMRVLDIGCGQGLALEHFRRLGLDAVGITLGPDCDVCREKGFDVHQMDQNFMDFADAQFDMLWCRHVLEHSVAPLFTLLEYRRVTKPGGLVYIEVPAPDTAVHHEANVNHYSVLPLSSWLYLFARAGLTTERSTAINFDLAGDPDTYWSFVLRRKD